MDVMVAATVSLLQLLRDRFDGKTSIAGFSFGAAIAALAAAQRPDLVARLVATGMDIDGAATTRQLEAIGPPPHLTSKQFGTRARWAANFGGVTRNQTYASLARGLLSSLLRCADYSPRDVVRTIPGITAMQAALLPDLATMDPTLPHIDVPVVILQGRYNQVARGELAQQYASSLQARGKQLIWFENSAHTPHLDVPARFRDVLLGIRDSQLTRT
jgi:pimeloyl-ACP methyl ester carboxylesterase